MYCAIDFGTSNSAIAIPEPGALGRMQLVELEPGHRTMPTAVFYASEGGAAAACEFGRAAIAAYVDGVEGRLMRSMKSILGSSFVEQTTDVGGGRGVRYLDIVTGYLRHLRSVAERAAGTALTRVVLGRPVFFVDDDPQRDAAAERALRSAAAAAGFRDVEFQYEPIAAAFDHEQSIATEERVLVVDVGGGTSDFSVVRVGPERRRCKDRRSDILASHGVHIAGTDFDRRIELATIMPALGYGALGPPQRDGAARIVPSRVYLDLATWHLINTVYAPRRVAELRAMRGYYADPGQHARLMRVIDRQLGHELAARAEAAKIAVAGGAPATVLLDGVEPGLAIEVTESAAARWLDDDFERIALAARQTVALAGLATGDVDALYFTGGSTGLRRLAEAIAAAFPNARHVRGDRFASVASGLAIEARRRYAETAAGSCR